MEKLDCVAQELSDKAEHSNYAGCVGFGGNPRGAQQAAITNG